MSGRPGGDPWAPVAKPIRCLRCGHEWIPRVPRPRRCANLTCQTNLWDEDPAAALARKMTYGCLRCRARWAARYGPNSHLSIGIPSSCARCRVRGAVVRLEEGGRFPPGKKWVPRPRTHCPTCHRAYAKGRG